MGLSPGDPLQTLETVYDSAPPAGPQGPYGGPASPALPTPALAAARPSSALQLLPHLPLPGALAFVPQRVLPSLGRSVQAPALFTAAVYSSFQ